MEDLNDDFGELYAEFEVHPTSAINNVSDFSQLHTNQQQQHSNEVEVSEKVLETGIDEVEVVNGSDSHYDDDDDDDNDDEDDFDVVVNDEEFEAKNGVGDLRRCPAEAVEDTEAAGFVEEPGKNQMPVDVEGTGRSGSNSQHKYLRRYGSVVAGNQQTSSWKLSREDALYGKSRMQGFGGNEKNFWLPWYRTIVDVDIDMFERKSWTHPGADMKDYFNFGFDEESWRKFCQSVDQLRQQTLSQTRNQVDDGSSFKLEKETLATKELDSEGFIGAEYIPSGLSKKNSHEPDFAAKQSKKKIGQAIHVEDSNIERQPSMDARRPRNRDSDVIIQITVQDQEEHSSSSGNEDPDNILGTQCTMSEKGCGHGIVELETEKPGGIKAIEIRKNPVEEIFRSSSASADCKRSCKSAAVSSHMLKDSKGHVKDPNSELDIQPSDETDTFPRGNLRAIEILNGSMKDDVDSASDTTETNPCVAGIELSFDDPGCTSPSLSYSNTWSEASKDNDHCDSRRTRNFRRSPSYSREERHQVAKVDYHRLSNRRDDEKVKGSGGKYCAGVRNSIEEDSKNIERRVCRHLKLSRNGEDENHLIGPEYSYSLGRSRAQHRRSDEWCLTSSSDDEYWPNYRKDEPSFGRYGRRSFENQFQTKRKRDIDRRGHWRSRDEMDLNFQREWDEEQCSSDRRMGRTRAVIVQKDWCLQERECSIRNEKPFFWNRQQFSSHDFEWFEQQREYDDVPFNKRSKHGQPLKYKYADEPLHNKYVRSNDSILLDDKQSEYFNSEIRHERHLWHSGVEVGTSVREDEYIESPSDLDYLQYALNDDDECWNGLSSAYAHDYRHEYLTDEERRHQIFPYRDGIDDSRLHQRYERHSRFLSIRTGTGGRQVYDHRDLYDRQDDAKYLNEDDYFVKRRNDFLSKGLSLAEDTSFDGFSDNDFCDENMLNSCDGVPRHIWHGAKHEFVPGGMTNMKSRFGVRSDSGGKSYSKMSRRANGLWSRNSVEVHNIVRERKSTGKFSKAGSLPNDDASEHANGRFQKQFKRQQERGVAFPYKKMGNKALNTEALRDKLPIKNNYNAAGLEDGQILPTEESKTDFFKIKQYGSGHWVQKDTLKESSHGQNGSCVYDENRILETKAKMEKRRERFKDSALGKKDTDSDPKHEVDKLVETAESKGQRPVRKRKWG